MSIKFEKPILGINVLFIEPKDLTEKKIRNMHNGRKYLKILQHAIDNKLVKYKNIPEMLKHFAKKEASDGCCIGEAIEFIKAIKNKGVKPGICKNVSKTSAIAHTLLTNLAALVKMKKKLQKSADTKIKINTKKVAAEKVKSFYKKTEQFYKKTLSEADLKEGHGKKFRHSKTDKAVKYISSQLKANNNFHSLISVMDAKKKNKAGHVIAAGVNNKKPFFYDSNRGYARLKNTKQLIELIKSKYLKKHKYNIEIQRFD